MKVKVTRLAPGAYTVRDGDAEHSEFDVVTVSRYDEGPWSGWWQAAARWDQHNYGDPVGTKREAVEQAAFMLAQLTEEV